MAKYRGIDPGAENSGIFDCIDKLLRVGTQDDFADARGKVQRDRNGLAAAMTAVGGDRIAAALLEDLVVHRVLGMRLLSKIGEEGVLQGGKSSTPRGHPALELWAKNQERYRKIMKELLERLNQGTGESEESLGELMAPILDKGEGVLDDAMEFEARKKSTEKEGDASGGDRGVAESA